MNVPKMQPKPEPPPSDFIRIAYFFYVRKSEIISIDFEGTTRRISIQFNTGNIIHKDIENHEEYDSSLKRLTKYFK